MLGVATLCPPIAVLGAKRPQNLAWQLIVLSLAIVLSLPVLRPLVLEDGRGPSVHSAQSWFLLILLVVASTNYLPTAYWSTSLMVSIGQIVLLYEFLPLSRLWPLANWLQANAFAVSLALFTSAICMVALGWPRRKSAAHSLNRLWLDFRDAFGAVWGLRVQQRVNQSASMYAWNVRLDWHGFSPRDASAISPQMQKAIEDNMKSVLRRFVSPQWIGERLETIVD
jgi:hypothetical protein